MDIRCLSKLIFFEILPSLPKLFDVNMGKYQKLLLKILSGSADANVEFEQLRRLLILFGFSERIKGSHHILTREDVEEIMNIQEIQGKAKPYQVKQVRNLILKYQLKLEGNDK